MAQSRDSINEFADAVSREVTRVAGTLRVAV
jgi:predicted transcriptional regulator